MNSNNKFQIIRISIIFSEDTTLRHILDEANRRDKSYSITDSLSLSEGGGTDTLPPLPSLKTPAWNVQGPR